jgi:hypothetical protein
MFKISQDFAPPFKLIAPFFILGSIFYTLSVIFLYTLDITNLTFANPEVLGFVHLFLLGFVMMVIFGAMAQLVPVVLEVGHFGVELFYAIWPLLLVGLSLMVYGFLASPATLPYGGVVVLTSMMIFVGEIFLTIFKVKKLTLVMKSVVISNIFLFFGIIFGLMMALSYAGVIDVEIDALLQAHLFAVIGGYIVLTIMGLSIVLVPMFTLAHSFSMRPLEIAIYGMTTSAVLAILASFFHLELVSKVAYLIAVVSISSYFSLIYTLYKTRPRKENDVYAISMMYAYISMMLSVTLMVVYALGGSEVWLLAGFWTLFFGFFGFLITGHIYKIIPFLVWFEKFSPLVGKQKVPMLADMVPPKSSQAQLIFSGIGVVVVMVAILSQSNQLLGAGASFLLLGSLAFIRNVFYMINFK